MDRRGRTNQTRRRIVRIAAVTCAAAVAIVPAACAPTLAVQGDSRTLAAYSGATLWAKMPEHVDVTTAAAAGESALVERGYVIHRREGTSGRSVVIGKTPAAGWRRHVDRTAEVRASQRRGGVRVEVSISPVPSQAESRAIFDAMLARLGI